MRCSRQQVSGRQVSSFSDELFCPRRKCLRPSLTRTRGALGCILLRHVLRFFGFILDRQVSFRDQMVGFPRLVHGRGVVGIVK